MSNIPANFTDGVLTISDDNGNSATLVCAQGDMSLSGLMAKGRQVTASESRGGLCGLRKAARAFPQLTFSAELNAPYGEFQALALGETIGFKSVTEDIGDADCVDFDFSFDYNAESRDITSEDLHFSDLTFTEGDPSTVSFTATVYGPLELDGNNIIPSR